MFGFIDGFPKRNSWVWWSQPGHPLCCQPDFEGKPTVNAEQSKRFSILFARKGRMASSVCNDLPDNNPHLVIPAVARAKRFRPEALATARAPWGKRSRTGHAGLLNMNCVLCDSSILYVSMTDPLLWTCHTRVSRHWKTWVWQSSNMGKTLHSSQLWPGKALQMRAPEIDPALPFACNKQLKPHRSRLTLVLGQAQTCACRSAGVADVHK